MEEVGPIVYNEVWRHQNIVFNNNGTMSYFVNKTLVYNPKDNNINLNATIVMPNIAVLVGTDRVVLCFSMYYPHWLDSQSQFSST